MSGLLRRMNRRNASTLSRILASGVLIGATLFTFNASAQQPSTPGTRAIEESSEPTDARTITFRPRDLLGIWYKVDVKQNGPIKVLRRPADVRDTCMMVVNIRVDQHGVVTYAKADSTRSACPVDRFERMEQLARSMTFFPRAQAPEQEGVIIFNDERR